MKKKPTEDMTENELLYLLLSKKVGAVNPYDVFYFKEGQNSAGQRVINYHLGGKKITANQANTLRSEAKMLQETYLYKVITETLGYSAKHMMFEGMKTLDDMHYGKAILYSVDIIQKIIESLSQMSVEEKLSTSK